MQWRNSSERFGLIAGLLHWSIVIGVIAQYFLAEAAEESQAQAGAFAPMSLHRSIGLTILTLAVLRLVWRLIDASPEWPASMKPFERRLARVTHIGFYALLLAVPLSGWALSSAEGDPLTFFDWFSLPVLPVAESLDHTLEEVHEILFNILAALGLVHVLAALKHQFIDHDGLLRRMLPGRN